MPARIKFELSQASHHARATHSQPASAHARKKPTHNSRSLTLLTSLPTGLDLALGKEVKNLNLLDLSVVGHPRFSVRLLVGLSAVTLPHITTPTTRPPARRYSSPPFPPRCRSTSSASRKAARRLDYVAVEAHLHARGLADEGRRQGRRRNPHPNPIPARPRPLLPPRRCAPRKGAGGESPPQRRLALEPAPASCLARPVPARLSQERTRTAGAGPCSPALARVLVLPAGSPSPLAPPPHPVPRGGSLYLRPRKSLGQPRPPRRNPRGCPRLTCGANSLRFPFTFHVSALEPAARSTLLSSRRRIFGVSDASDKCSER